jgi:ADP-L-glycero-D-manno-heptose 6-epimerase
VIVVTGGAGFIGSNFVRALIDRGERDLAVVDEFNHPDKISNLAGIDLSEQLDKDEFIAPLRAGRHLAFRPRAIIHQGACSDTMELDERYMMETNYVYSKTLFEYCLQEKIPFLYASSASVYGDGRVFRESPEFEKPLNIYARSKHLFDQQVRDYMLEAKSQLVGFRYFNVYGPGEAHKGRMASVAHHFNQQIKRDGKVRLFEGSDGFGDGEQRRDFIYVDDVVQVGLWFLDHPDRSGIFNVGTARSQTFNDVANAVIAWHGGGSIEYVPFPAALRGRYQSFTEADIGALRDCGYEADFRSVEDGVRAYLDALRSRQS